MQVSISYNYKSDNEKHVFDFCLTAMSLCVATFKGGNDANYVSQLNSVCYVSVWPYNLLRCNVLGNIAVRCNVLGDTAVALEYL